ncbi:hypothetical protein [Geobacter sp.]|uniref:hypothetical protein n=1 Tax=Geobacter sp. TaxID=46610 RepID=UPI00262D49B6|nr:hypothetical protein [Geobacter sp.]
MELLQPMEGRGYPADYLLARLKGRRGYLVADWEGVLAAAEPLAAIPPSPYRPPLVDATDEGVWAGLLREYGWVRRQMDEGLRRLFAPVFGCAELRTLVLALRAVEGGEKERAERLLAHSLLPRRLLHRLRGSADLAAAVAAVAEETPGAAAWRRRLGEAFRRRGVAGVEETLTDRHLAEGATARHPEIGVFFAYLVDGRNIVALHKHLRWRIAFPLPLVAGGRLRPDLFRNAAAAGDPAAVFPLVARLTGREAGPEAGSVEHLLLTGLTRKLRRRGRESEVAQVLDYLWRCAVEARNLSLLIHGGAQERAALRTEVVR